MEKLPTSATLQDSYEALYILLPELCSNKIPEVHTCVYTSVMKMLEVSDNYRTPKTVAKTLCETTLITKQQCPSCKSVNIYTFTLLL